MSVLPGPPAKTMATVSLSMRCLTMALCALLWLPVAPVSAAPAACGAEPVHLLEEANWPPFTLESGGLATRGLSYELMQLIFSRLGQCVDIELLPQARLLERLTQGRDDGVTLIRFAPERTAFLAYTDSPLVTLRGDIYVRSDGAAPARINGWEDLRGLRVGTVRGRNYPDDFKQARDAGVFTVVEVVSSEQLLGMLARGRLDAVPFLEIEAAQFLSRAPYAGKLRRAEPMRVDIQFYLALTRTSRHRASLEQINQVIAQLRASGELGALLAKYGL